MEFHCNCASCGKLPEQKEDVLRIWVESREGMLCEDCWKKGMEVLPLPDIPEKNRHEEREAFCCFCVLCGRTPPDPEVKIWIETEKGCLCEVCLKGVAKNGIEREIKKIVEG